MYGEVVRTFDPDVHTRFVENVTGQHPKKMFSMFKSEVYHKGIIYSCERICISKVNGLMCRRSDRQEPTLVGFNIKAEDPRLIVCNNEVYIIFNHSRSGKTFPRCMAISPFDNWKPVTLEVAGVEDDVRTRNEKNWTPFIKDGKLHFVYNFEPLVILTYDFNEEGQCPIIYPSGDTTLAETERTYIRGGSNLIPYKGHYQIGACHSRVKGKYVTAYHTHIVILDTSCFNVVYLSKPVAFRHEKQDAIMAQGPYHFNEWYRIKFIREIMFPLGRLPMSDEINTIMSPCSMYVMDGKIYMTVNIQDSLTFRYEVYLEDIDLADPKNEKPKNLNLFTKEALDEVLALIPVKSARKQTKACCFV